LEKLAPGGTALVLGLGNPGSEYAGTRHNLGAEAVQLLAGRHGMALGKKGHQSLWHKGRVGDRPVILALPQTYMNLSGQAAHSLMSYFRLGPESLVVVHDEMDLEVGRIKVARGGGPGSHLGVRSVLQAVGSEDFARLKLGAGRPRYGEDKKRYVLEGFYADQRERVSQMVAMAADCLEVMLVKGLGEAMQQFHTRTLSEEVEG